MATGRQLRRSDLFLVRLWSEETDEGETAWWGKVQRAATGEASSFHDLPELMDLLLAMLPAARAGQQKPAGSTSGEQVSSGDQLEHPANS